MPERPNVLFVLGAGASADYGYPTGEGLIRAIDRGLTGPGANLHEFVNFPKEDLLRLSSQLLSSCQPSIDDFLRSRREYAPQVKELIAATLLLREGAHPLVRSGDRDRGWYEDLWSLLGPTYEDFCRRQVRFLTFNYDRSLEQFLFRSLSAAFGQPPEVLRECPIFKQIRHVYGDLGPTEWMVSPAREDESVRFGHGVTKAVVSRAAKNILTIGEINDFQHSDHLSGIREWVTSASLVVFLGFGFHKTNLQILQVTENKNCKWFYGCGYGIPGGPRVRIRERCGRDVKLGERSHKISEFLGELVELHGALD